MSLHSMVSSLKIHEPSGALLLLAGDPFSSMDSLGDAPGGSQKLPSEALQKYIPAVAALVGMKRLFEVSRPVPELCST